MTPKIVRVSIVHEKKAAHTVILVRREGDDRFTSQTTGNKDPKIEESRLEEKGFRLFKRRDIENWYLAEWYLPEQEKNT